ncbi:MAG: 50S ribosomal protein L25 [Firmicutes bacterium]|nr:50S ribosomal protein L25 [Bacillota bacterium]
MKVYLRTRPLREVRKDLMIPGAIYGKSIESESIEVEDKVFKEALSTYGKTMTFPITLNKKKLIVYIKNVQKNAMNQNDIIHFELHCITKDEIISSRVPFVIHGKDEVEKRKLFVQMAISSVECEYSADQGVSKFEFNVENMNVDDAIYIKDIAVPKGVKILDDPEHLIFIIKESSLSVESPEEEETETVDLPEVESETKTE